VDKRFLEEHVRARDRVLEIGSGPGRCTFELALVGARVVVGDVSPRQIEAHRERTRTIEGSIEDRVVLDVVDLTGFRDGEFDATVCYGGPMSYVLERADDALAEQLRVTRRGGRALLTFMSQLGAARTFFPMFRGLTTSTAGTRPSPTCSRPGS
jgi:ubiquinone/menaquinone biosynthesis C-methylase UbiE